MVSTSTAAVIRITHVSSPLKGANSDSVGGGMFLPHRTSIVEAELAEGCRNKKILQALTSVTGSPSVFDAEGSETSDHLSPRANLTSPRVGSGDGVGHPSLW